MNKIIRAGSLLIIATWFLVSCYPPQPKETQNICDIFQQYPDWYADALKTQNKWSVPVAVQMAIIYEESGFQATAEPPPIKRLGKIIPWHRESSALGYCQALNGTWECYEQNTGKALSRDDFASASDFIGWYANQAYQFAHIEPNDAYNLYLAYHEGLGGYHAHSYWHKPWLMEIAHRVESHALMYADQLQQCQSSIPQPVQE